MLKGIVRGKFSPASNKLVSASVACDTGAVLIQLLKHSGASTRVDPSFLEDARAAACHADSILDSLQMPCIQATVPTPVIVHPSSSSSEGSCDKGELDSDDSVEDPGDKSSMENEYSLMGLESNFT